MTSLYFYAIPSILPTVIRIYMFILGLFSLGITHAQFLKDKKTTTYDGYFNFHYVEEEDKIYLEVRELNKEFLYVYSLSQGVGSNDIGLDRGQLGNEQVVYFKKAGNKLLLVQPNLSYRALTDNPLEKRSVEQAFARSVLFGFPIEETKDDTYLIDLTPFLIRDAHGVSQRLKQRKQGTYKLNKDRSALALDFTKAFPKNVEFEALLTFRGEPKGSEIRSVAPNPRLVSVVQHHSFIQLPDNQYTPRAFDPRGGSFSITYMDYATPVQEPIVKRWITRHRLEKKDPSVAVSEAVEPIIYYLDNGTPEPIRSALLDGARWWNEGFERIGFKDAFQVEILPNDADPMDVRYNVIQWVHRSTRGWSYGSSITDPRTGEIIKGHVSLGSLRIRQDFLIAQALMNRPFAAGDDNYQPMLDLALARIRQLSAHEVGHTLGFAHNFAASANGSASVMDYPHPMLSVKNGTVDFSQAYDTGIGAWDMITIAYSYSPFAPETNEKAELNKILQRAQQEGLRFISDYDARPQGGSHALAHLWDNGASAVEELKNVMEVRHTAIESFSADNIRSDEPFSVLEDVFVPLYFFHRYQTEAAVKLIGGMDYNYAVKGDGQTITKALPAFEQEAALEAVLSTLDTEQLMIPEDVLSLLPPSAMGYGRSRESFKGSTGVAFDALGAASTASDMSLGLLLHPERASRLVQQKAMDNSQLGFEHVIDELLDQTFKAPQGRGYALEVQHSVNFNVLNHLMSLANNIKAYPQVRAIARYKIKRLKEWLQQQRVSGLQQVYFEDHIRQIDAFQRYPEKFKVMPAPKIPDGSPIGTDCGG